VRVIWTMRGAPRRRKKTKSPTLASGALWVTYTCGDRSTRVAFSGTIDGQIIVHGQAWICISRSVLAGTGRRRPCVVMQIACHGSDNSHMLADAPPIGHSDRHHCASIGYDRCS
jgi:hypothetical protein